MQHIFVSETRTHDKVHQGHAAIYAEAALTYANAGKDLCRRSFSKAVSHPPKCDNSTARNGSRNQSSVEKRCSCRIGSGTAALVPEVLHVYAPIKHHRGLAKCLEKEGARTEIASVFLGKVFTAAYTTSFHLRVANRSLSKAVARKPLNHWAPSFRWRERLSCASSGKLSLPFSPAENVAPRSCVLQKTAPPLLLLPQLVAVAIPAQEGVRLHHACGWR